MPRQFAHAADGIDRRTDFMADVGEEVVLALFGIHQGFNDFIYLVVVLILPFHPDIHHIFHTENISGLSQQVKQGFALQGIEGIGNDAMIKENKRKRNEGKP